MRSIQKWQLHVVERTWKNHSTGANREKRVGSLSFSRFCFKEWTSVNQDKPAGAWQVLSLSTSSKSSLMRESSTLKESSSPTVTYEASFLIWRFGHLSHGSQTQLPQPSSGGPKPQSPQPPRPSMATLAWAPWFRSIHCDPSASEDRLPRHRNHRLPSGKTSRSRDLPTYWPQLLHRKGLNMFNKLAHLNGLKRPNPRSTSNKRKAFRRSRSFLRKRARQSVTASKDIRFDKSPDLAPTISAFFCPSQSAQHWSYCNSIINHVICLCALALSVAFWVLKSEKNVLNSTQTFST